MMNNDNSITAETKLYGYIAENAHSSRLSSILNALFKGEGVNAMMIPMNIRPDDVAFTVSQMRTSKLSGAVIATEYQEEAFALVDHRSKTAGEEGICDFIRIGGNELSGDLITPRALEKYAHNDTFADEIALRSVAHYLYDLITGETA